MRKDNYRLRLKDFIPLAGIENYEIRNSFVPDPNVVRVEFDTRARGRMSFLEVYNVFILGAVPTGLILLI